MKEMRFLLFRGPRQLGTLVLKPELTTFPWFGGHFRPTRSFAEVEPLFEEESWCADTGDIYGWMRAWTGLNEPKLVLMPIDAAPIEDFIIRFTGNVAKWRMHFGPLPAGVANQ